jgi:hypothetical protein
MNALAVTWKSQWSAGRQAASPAIAARRAARAIVVVGFAAVLGLPGLGTLWCRTGEFVEQNEQRPPAPAPVLEFRPGRIVPRKRSLVAFPAAAENWFTDHLGYRREFLGLLGSARVWGVAPAGLAGGRQWVGTPVVVGRDGWLFYGGESSLESYRRTRPFSSGELDQWRAGLASRARWAAARGIRYVVLVTPDKHSLYGEHMPRSLEPGSGPSRLEQIAAALRPEDGVALVDLCGPLARWKPQYRLYHKTDTHWNDVGAMLGCEHLVGRLREWFPAVRPRGPEDFVIEPKIGPGGDLARMLGAPWGWQEERIGAVPREPWTATTTDASTAELRVRIAENPAGGVDRAVVLHDSFLEAMEPYFSAHCRRACYLRTHEFPTDEIAAEHPQLIVQQFVERHFMGPPPEVIEESSPVGLADSPHPTDGRPIMRPGSDGP